MKFLSIVNIFFLVVLICFIHSDDIECDQATPRDKNECFQINVSIGKKCCYFSSSSLSPIKKCAPISIGNYFDYIEGIEEFKTDNSITSEIEYDCGTEMERNCINIINPVEKLACSGRKIEEPLTCCFVKDDNGNKRCFPLDKSADREEFANLLQMSLGLTNTPSVKCNGNYKSLSLLFLILFLILVI